MNFFGEFLTLDLVTLASFSRDNKFSTGGTCISQRKFYVRPSELSRLYTEKYINIQLPVLRFYTQHSLKLPCNYAIQVGTYRCERWASATYSARIEHVSKVYRFLVKALL